jgi:hypothetical protein
LQALYRQTADMTGDAGTVAGYVREKVGFCIGWFNR